MLQLLHAALHQSDDVLQLVRDARSCLMDRGRPEEGQGDAFDQLTTAIRDLEITQARLEVTCTVFREAKTKRSER